MLINPINVVNPINVDHANHANHANHVQPARASGLEDVIAAHTRLSDVDGEAGRLVIAGYPVEDLAGAVTFEEAVFRLWNGRRPTTAELEDFRSSLGRARAAARFTPVPNLPDPMDTLRARTAQLAGDDPIAILGGVAMAAAPAPAHPTFRDDATGATTSRGAEARPSGSRASGSQASGSRASGSRASGSRASGSRASGSRATPPGEADPTLGHAADYLRLLTGKMPSPEAVAALDAYLVAVIDHGMNASTFTARVVASTASDSVSAVTAAIGALKGKLHGGAPGPVLDMLDAIGSEENARDWLATELAKGERIMGMGHRIYRARDPRAFVLERALGKLGATSSRLRLARAVEREAETQLAAKQPARALKCNVEFYTAILLEAVGLPRDRFTTTFAVSRTAGWLAHIAEQRATGKLIRPKSVYVGGLASERVA